MSEIVAGAYKALISTVAIKLVGLGFKSRSSEEFIRTSAGLLQRLAFSLREPPGESSAYVEVFPGFNFPEVESLAASLQGKKPRAGFITCSLNIGLLSPKGANLEWSLSLPGEAEALAQVVSQAIVDFAVPFWDEFSTVDKLLARLEAGDFRLCRGAEWPWRQAAAYCLLGLPARAADFLQGRLSQTPAPARPIIEAALRKISQLPSR